MKFQSLRGTSDLWGDDVGQWTSLEAIIRETSTNYGYREIRTPIMEEAGLFLRSIGEASDIVQKEMFRFQDRGGNDIILRPEGTAAVARAFLQHKLHKQVPLNRLFYMGPMFRAERPQAGRFRQFHQFGCEALGSSHPAVDTEVIALCYTTLRACGLNGLKVNLTSMGSREDQTKSADALRQRLTASEDDLCSECRERLNKNVFRILDCKRDACRKLGWRGGWPFQLSPESQEHFDSVKRLLEAAEIPFSDTTAFARGLDYYTRTVFEVEAEGLGAQNVVAAGGRYDHLIEDLGGPSIQAVGFAAGIERILIALGNQPAAPARDGIFIVATETESLEKTVKWSEQLRRNKVRAMMDFNIRSLKSQFREADRLNMAWVAIYGAKERESGRIQLKDLSSGEQRSLPVDTWTEQFCQLIESNRD